jgi:hypothetical protein
MVHKKQLLYITIQIYFKKSCHLYTKSMSQHEHMKYILEEKVPMLEECDFF